MTELPADDLRHATVNGYNNLGCRCTACTQAWSSDVLAIRKRRPSLSPDDPRHGKATTYTNWKCRCDTCRAAWAKYSAALRARKRVGT